MIKLCQRDPKWANLKLGKSNLTVGRYGCTTTALAMVSDVLGCYCPPNIIAITNNYYTKDGLILWPNLKFACFSFVKRFYGLDTVLIDEHLKWGNAAILEVDKSHWVLAVWRIPMTKQYIIIDPWTGKRSTTWKYRKITGGAVFEHN